MEERATITQCMYVFCSNVRTSTGIDIAKAITAMVRELRKGKKTNGLVLANGGVATYQHVVCLSSKPGQHQYPAENPLPAVITDVAVPTIDNEAEGEAVIEVSVTLLALCLPRRDLQKYCTDESVHRRTRLSSLVMGSRYEAMSLAV